MITREYVLKCIEDDGFFFDHPRSVKHPANLLSLLINEGKIEKIPNLIFSDSVAESLRYTRHYRRTGAYVFLIEVEPNHFEIVNIDGGQRTREYTY